MSPEQGFVAFLLVTLALLAAVVVTGYREQRAAHLTLVALAVGSLGITIWYAEQMGEHFDLESAGAITPVHLFLAKATTFAYLLPIASGVATIRNSSWKTLHRRLAFLVLALTVLTAVTGTWMLAAAERVAAAGPPPASESAKR